MHSQIFLQILRMTAVSSIVILLVFAARILLKKAPKAFSYALWLVVLFRLLCPYAVQAPVSLIPDIEQVSGQAISTDAVQTTSVSQPEAGWVQAGAYIWLAGAAVMLLLSCWSHFRLRGALAGASLLRDNIYIADHVSVPFVMGIVSPSIYLPSRLRDVEFCYVIAHEQHHIRRLDHIWRPLSYCALCIHWFNPLVWAAFILAGRDMEMSCDEAVLRQLGAWIRADYSASILNLSAGPHIPTDTSPAFGGCNTKERLINMANWKKPNPWVSVIAAIFCLCILAGCAVDTADPQTTDPEITLCADPACTDTTHEHVHLGSDISTLLVYNEEENTIESNMAVTHHITNKSHHQEEHNNDHHS